MDYDVVIVGAGPAGIFTALELIQKGSGQKIIMIEKGSAVEKRSCPKNKTGECMSCKPYCHITTGFSGAGAFSDGKLSLNYEVGGDLPMLIGEKKAQETIDYTDKIYLKFGADTHVEGLENSEEVKEIFCHTDLSAWPGARIAAFKGVPIYSGHIHYEYMDPTANLYNIGSACSFTFNDVNMDKYLYVLENYRIVDRIKNYVTPKFIRLYNDEIFEVTDEKFNNSYVQLCISSNNIKKAKYVEQINNLKTTYINSNIRLHIIDEDTNLTTLSVASFNSNIESYIESNIPAYLNDKYTFIKNKINQV